MSNHGNQSPQKSSSTFRNVQPAKKSVFGPNSSVFSNKNSTNNQLSDNIKRQTTKDLLEKAQKERYDEDKAKKSNSELKTELKPELNPELKAEIDLEKSVSPTTNVPQQQVPKQKVVRSFSSYLQNVENRKTEIAEQERKRKLEEELKLKQEEESKSLVAQMEIEKIDEKLEENELNSVKEKEVEQEKQNLESNDITKFDDAPTSPLSNLSSELTILPSERSKPSLDIPPSISERESEKQLDKNEDSDAETVYTESPQKPRRGRLVRKSDLDRENSAKLESSVDSHDNGNNDNEHNDNDDNDNDDNDNENDNDNNNYKSHVRSPSRSLSPTRAGGNKKSRIGRDSSGRLKLQRACDKGKFELAKKLIEEGADVNDQDYAGNSALHEAALKGYTKIVKLLLDNGAKVDIKSGPDDLDTPLIDAASNNHVETVELLLKYGADPRIQNAHGQNALDSLDDENIDEENQNDIKYLKKILREASINLKSKSKSLDKSSSNVSDDISTDGENNSNNKNNNNSNRKTTSRRTQTRNDLFWMDFTTRNGREEVYQRAADGDIEFVGTYLANGGKPDSNALALAAKFGHTDVVNLFLGFGCKVDNFNEKGLTPLMQTVGRGHLETVKLLLQAGANPNKKSKDGKLALDIALESLLIDDEEIKLLKTSMKSANSGEENELGEDDHNNKSDTKNAHKTKHDNDKKRKISTSSNIENETEVKKKKSVKPSPEVSKKTIEKERKGVDNKSINKSSATTAPPPAIPEIVMPKKAEIIPKHIESKFSHSAKHETKRVVSSSSLSSNNAHTSKDEQIQDAETQQQDSADDAKKREEYEAARLAKRKAREQEYLNNFEVLERKKQEELEKLLQLEEEKRLKEEKENEMKLKQLEEEKLLVLKKEEIEKRLKIRENYPSGLKFAKFNIKLNEEEIRKYLPVYFKKIGGVRFISDLQLILILRVENFYKKYDFLTKDLVKISNNEKYKIFNYFYSFLGNFSRKGTQSINSQIENYNEEFNKFLRLSINWINFDELISNQDFKNEFPIVFKLLKEEQDENMIEFSDEFNNADIIKFNLNLNENKKTKFNSKLLPIKFRNRPSILKTFSKTSKLW